MKKRSSTNIPSSTTSSSLLNTDAPAPRENNEIPKETAAIYEKIARLITTDKKWASSFDWLFFFFLGVLSCFAWKFVLLFLPSFTLGGFLFFECIQPAREGGGGLSLSLSLSFFFLIFNISFSSFLLKPNNNKIIIIIIIRFLYAIFNGVSGSSGDVDIIAAAITKVSLALGTNYTLFDHLIRKEFERSQATKAILRANTLTTKIMDQFCCERRILLSHTRALFLSLSLSLFFFLK